MKLRSRLRGVNPPNGDFPSSLRLACRQPSRTTQALVIVGAVLLLLPLLFLLSTRLSLNHLAPATSLAIRPTPAAEWHWDPSSVLSRSNVSIQFTVQTGLRVVTEQELHDLHVKHAADYQRQVDTGTPTAELWDKCDETNVSAWTCSHCTYPLLEYHYSWSGADTDSLKRSARLPEAGRLHANHFTGGAVPLHGLVHAVHESYRRHLPLTLAVEDVWLLITQGLSHHINHGNNAERLRHHFVRHAGREKLLVAEMSWEAMFAGFSAEIVKRTVPGRSELFARPFSASSPLQMLTMQAALMEAMQTYYEYQGMLTCGIPSVRLLGTEADWLDLQSRLEQLQLSQLDPALQLWETGLKAIVGRMVESRLGRVDVAFWQSIYRMRTSSIAMFMGCAGPPDVVDGWFGWFFPYLTPDRWQHKYTDLEVNPYILIPSPEADSRTLTFQEETPGDTCTELWQSGSWMMGGRLCMAEMSLSRFPTGISRVPLKWLNGPKGETDMYLYAGFDDASIRYESKLTGVVERGEGDGEGVRVNEVRAQYGWALAYAD